MPQRTVPYGAFNFLVNISGGRDAAEPLGGFSDVTGLGTEMVTTEYRDGNEKENHVRKVPLLHKVSDVTLKRGVVNSRDLWDWIKQVRTTGHAAKRDVTITLRDEAGQGVMSWKLAGAFPLRYSGPALAAKGGDVAMEELVLASDGLEFEQAG